MLVQMTTFFIIHLNALLMEVEWYRIYHSLMTKLNIFPIFYKIKKNNVKKINKNLPFSKTHFYNKKINP